jgi:tetratricopeptide (TPR) repeat protein
MHSYSVRDVERVLRLSRSTIRGLIDGGFVKPTRGPRRQYRFSFQDLIVLRTAQALTQAKVSRRRIHRSLEDLRQHLPDTMPLSGLSIHAVGERVVVRDGGSRWQVDDGQYLLELDFSVVAGSLSVVERKEHARVEPAATGEDPSDWFNAALELEEDDPGEAQKAYERAVKEDPGNTAAWTNWGRLLHEQGHTKEAESVYRRALSRVARDPLLLFNLGVLLEDTGRLTEAMEAYQAAIEGDPTLADGHFNLARLYDSMGKPQHAIRHLGQYRRLVTNESH